MTTLLRQRREQLGLAADELADRLGVHPNSIHRWERQSRLPAPEHVRGLADALALDTADVAAFFHLARSSRPAPALGPRGHALRSLRRSAGHPAAALADELGVLTSTIYNWEAGRARIPAEKLPPLAALLAMEVERLESVLRRTAPAVPAPPSALRRLRQRRGLSQSEVARRIGRTRHLVGVWERGADVPSLADARRLAATYGVPVAVVAGIARVSVPLELDRRRWQPGSLGAVLAALRSWSGETQGELAARSGCCVSSVRKWERGVTLPSSRSLRALEAAFGLGRGELDRTLPTPA